MLNFDVAMLLKHLSNWVAILHHAAHKVKSCNILNANLRFLLDGVITHDPFAEAIDQLRTGCLYPIQNQLRMNIRAQ